MIGTPKKYWLLVGILAAVFLLNWQKVVLAWVEFSQSFPGGNFNWATLDNILSFWFLPLVLLSILFFHSSAKRILRRLNSITYTILIILLPVLFAPLFTVYQPYNLTAEKGEELLPPFSTVKYLIEVPEAQKSMRNFDIQKTLFESFEKLNGRWIAHVNGNSFEVTQNKYQFKNDEPIVVTNFHLLGTDEFGRDVYTRIIFGARTSFSIAAISVFMSLLIGLLLGFSAGFSGKFVDLILSRITEMFLALPSIFLVILALLLFGSSFWTIAAILGLSGWMSIFKIVKDKTIEEKDKDYFQTSVSLGFSMRHLLFKELMASLIPHISTAALFQFGNVILAESALNFLGIGFEPRIPSWGALIRSGQTYISEGWWLIVFPGLAIVLSLIFINFAAQKLVTVINPQFK